MPDISGILADVAAFANPFGAPSQGQWNLQKGIFVQNQNGSTPAQFTDKNSITFFYETKDPDPSQHTAIDQLTDGGGRRLAVFEYPYIDGQKIIDLGRKGETFNFNIKFHGLNYQVLFKNFINIVVNYNGQGTIFHPVRGAILVRFRDYEFLHRYDEWNAVTIKATFIEDSTNTALQTSTPSPSSDSALRNALQFLTTTQATISTDLTQASALLALPGAIANAMQSRLTSVVGQISGLLGQLAATFSSSTQLQTLFSQSSNIVGGISNLTSGTVVAGTQQAQLPPVYQVGFDPATQAAINTQLANFINASTISPQQAVFNTNQVRNSLSAAITEINTNLGNNGYDIMLLYRGLAVAIQQATEACISSVQNLVTIYTTTQPMSLRLVAQANNLLPEDQNIIENLNPYLASVNYIEAGTQIIVPAS